MNCCPHISRCLDSLQQSMKYTIFQYFTQNLRYTHLNYRMRANIETSDISKVQNKMLNGQQR